MIDSTASRILALRAARPSHRVPAFRFVRSGSLRHSACPPRSPGRWFGTGRPCFLNRMSDVASPASTAGTSTSIRAASSDFEARRLLRQSVRHQRQRAPGTGPMLVPSLQRGGGIRFKSFSRDPVPHPALGFEAGLIPRRSFFNSDFPSVSV
jgi:hypothetical protein